MIIKPNKTISNISAGFFTAVLVAALAACSAKNTALQSQTINVCVGSAPNTLDPSYNVAIDGGTIITHFFEGLYTLPEAGKPVPAQAETCHISEDGLTYTFTLRDGLLWSDHSPLLAEDYVYSWRRLADPASGNTYSYMLQGVAGYEEALESNDMSRLQISAPDSKTLLVRLKVPDNGFLTLVSAPYFVPVQKAAVEKGGETWALSPETYISNGPFIMKEYKDGSYILAEKNPFYWNHRAVVSDEIKFSFFSDHNSELAAFEAKELQFADDLPVEEIQRFKGTEALKTVPLMSTYYLSINTSGEPLDNPLVRKALTLSIDRSWICENIGKSGEIPAGAFVPPVISDAEEGKRFRDGKDYFNALESGNGENKEEARKALVQAGYPEGRGLPVLELLYVEGSVYEAVAEAIQSQWAEVGIKARLRKQEWGSFLSNVQSKNYQIASLSWVADIDDPDDFLSLFLSDGGNNFTGWGDPKYDELLKSLKRTAVDEKTRYKTLHEAEDILFDQWAVCPLYYFVDTYLQAPELKGVKVAPSGIKSFVYAQLTVDK